MAARADLDASVRAADPARWLASRFAPPAQRRRLVALYAFHHEIARVREVVSDPLVGEIRLAWWREAIAEVWEDPARVRRHPVVLALAEALGEGDRPALRTRLEALIDARARDLDERAFAGLEEVSDYAAATAGGLVKAAAAMLGEGGAHEPGLEAAGRAWGLAGLAQALPVHAARGWIAAPDAPSTAEIAALLAARDAAAVRALAAPLVEASRAALADARTRLAGAQAALWPAYGYATLIEPLLDALSRPGADPFAIAAEKPGLAARLRLVRSAFLGRL